MIPTANSGPDAIISGPNQTLWFTELSAGKIGEFNSTTLSFIQEFTIPYETHANPATLAMDGLGRIWFTDQNQSYPSVWMFDTNHVFHRFLTNVPNSTPVFVLPVQPIDIWFTDTTANYLGEINYTSGRVTQYPLPTSRSGPTEIALQRGTSYLWITESYSSKIARFDMNSHTFKEFTPSVSLKYPIGIVVDNSGNVWVPEHGGSSITELFPSNSTFRKYPTSQPTAPPGTGPATLAIDSLGRLWFAEHYANRIGRLDPNTATIDEFVIPTAGAYSLLDSIDSAGNFWFTEYYANEIGEILGNSSSHVNITAKSAPNGVVAAGQTASSQMSISNNLSTQLRLSLNVTSSFTADGVTKNSEVSLSNATLTLSPGQTATVTAGITPDFSLASGYYAVGVVAAYGNTSSIGIIFLHVQGSPVYLLESYVPEILLAAGVVLLMTLILLRKRRSGPKQAVHRSAAKPGASITMLPLLFALAIQVIGVANAKCPGYPQPTSNGPDYYGIALDAGSIAFFATVAYLLIRSRLRARKQGKDD